MVVVVVLPVTIQRMTKNVFFEKHAKEPVFRKHVKGEPVS